MKGRPFILWIVFAAAWAVLLIPLVRITLQHPAPKPQAVDTGETIETWISLRFSVEPERFSIAQHGALLWSEDDTTSKRIEYMVPLVFDDYGTEVEFSAQFPPGEVAVQIILAPDLRAERSQTIWVEDEETRTVRFSWGSPHE